MCKIELAVQDIFFELCKNWMGNNKTDIAHGLNRGLFKINTNYINQSNLMVGKFAWQAGYAAYIACPENVVLLSYRFNLNTEPVKAITDPVLSKMEDSIKMLNKQKKGAIYFCYFQ